MPVAAPQQNPLPGGFHLPAGWIVRVHAIDVATGADVAGVLLQSVSLEVTNVAGGALDELASGAFRLVLGPGASA